MERRILGGIFIFTAIIVLLAGCIGGGAKGPEPLNLDNLSANTKAMADAYVAVDGAGYMKGVTKVFIPSFQVEFITKSSASAHAYGWGNQQSADVSVSYLLKGIDNGVFQALTDQLYAETIADLKEKGFDIIPTDVLLANPVYQKIAAFGKPSPLKTSSRVEPKAGESVICAPKGMPVYFSLHDPQVGISSVFSQFGAAAQAEAPHNLEGQLIGELGATMVRVRLVVGFTDVREKAGVGEAKVGGSMRFSIAADQSQIAFYNSVDSYEAGFEGNKRMVYTLRTDKVAAFKLKQAIISPDAFDKEIVDTTGTTAKVVEGAFNVLSSLAGTGTSKAREYEVIADAGAYEKTAEKYMAAYCQLMAAKLPEPK
ncbi:MAG: hypothetical protein ABIL58_08980 [Pseudomonadota bacterium]